MLESQLRGLLRGLVQALGGRQSLLPDVIGGQRRVLEGLLSLSSLDARCS